MKILLCSDSWKGSLDADQACEAIADGLRQILPNSTLWLHPLADGGEGTLERVHSARPGTWVHREVSGPLPHLRVRAPWLWWPDTRSALVEMARCAGLPLLSTAARSPLQATTRGVGELLDDAREHGAETITLAVGGSATVDGGVGAARALGWRFLDARGGELPEGGGALATLDRILAPSAPFPVPIEVLCDVTNPLLGPRGAARVFAPQKGASPSDVDRLEEGLSRLADLFRNQHGLDPSRIPGAGAAGGLAFGAMAFLGARLSSGVQAVLRLTHFQQKAKEADWIVTGEGRFDAQSLDGKVVAGVLDGARAGHARVAVVSGSAAVGREEAQRAGISLVIGANDNAGLRLEEAMLRARELAMDAGRHLAARIRDWPENTP